MFCVLTLVFQFTLGSINLNRSYEFAKEPDASGSRLLVSAIAFESTKLVTKRSKSASHARISAALISHSNFLTELFEKPNQHTTVHIILLFNALPAVPISALGIFLQIYKCKVNLSIFQCFLV